MDTEQKIQTEIEPYENNECYFCGKTNENENKESLIPYFCNKECKGKWLAEQMGQPYFPTTESQYKVNISLDDKGNIIEIK